MSEPAGGALRNEPHAPHMATALSDRRNSDEQEISHVLQMLWVRKWSIMAIMLVWMALGFAYVSLKKPQFSATAVMLIERQGGSPLSGVGLALGGLPSSGYINSEIEILRSPEILHFVLADLSLTTDPEFAPNTDKYPNLTPVQYNQILIENFQKSVTVRPVSGSSIVRVEVRSESPSKAANIANTLVKIYIEKQLELKFKEAEKISGWLDQKKQELESRMQEDLTAYQEYQAKTGLIGSSILTFHNQEFLQLNAQLLDAEKQYTLAKSKLEYMREQSTRPGGLNAFQDVLTSQTIIALKASEAQRKADLASIQTRYGAKHPERVKAEAELEKIQTQILQEIRMIVGSVEGQVKTAEAAKREIELRIQGLRDDFRKNKNDKLITLQDLQMKSEASKKLYESFLNVYQSTSPHKNMQQADAKIISYAQPPVRPSHPNKRLVLALSGLIGLFLGIFIALVLDRLDDGFRHVRDVEDFTGFPLYGLIPEGKNIDGNRAIRHVLDKPASTLAESMRTLRMNLALRSYDDEDVRVITMTSTSPDEGKSTLSAWLAIVASKAGERVLLIDCDLRRPKLHKCFGLNQTKTLVEYLTDRAVLSEIISKDDASGVNVIPCKATPTHALSLLTSTKMEAMLDDLRNEYDLIILDAPAASTLSDPFILSKLSDRTLFVFEWAKTGREELGATIRKFYDIHCDTVGMVLNKIDFKKAGMDTRSSLSYAYSLDDLKKS